MTGRRGGDIWKKHSYEKPRRFFITRQEAPEPHRVVRHDEAPDP